MEEVSVFRLQQKTVLDLVKEVRALRMQKAEKDRRNWASYKTLVAYLKSRVADLEQYTQIM